MQESKINCYQKLHFSLGVAWQKKSLRKEKVQTINYLIQKQKEGVTWRLLMEENVGYKAQWDEQGVTYRVSKQKLFEQQKMNEWSSNTNIGEYGAVDCTVSKMELASPEGPQLRIYNTLLQMKAN